GLRPASRPLTTGLSASRIWSSGNAPPSSAWRDAGERSVSGANRGELYPRPLQEPHMRRLRLVGCAVAGALGCLSTPARAQNSVEELNARAAGERIGGALAAYHTARMAV